MTMPAQGAPQAPPDQSAVVSKAPAAAVVVNTTALAPLPTAQPASPNAPETAAQKLAGQVSQTVGALGVVYLASAHVLTGREALAGLLLLLLPLELTRRVLGLLQARLGVAGATGTVGAAAAALAVATKAQTGGVAAVVGLSVLAGFLSGCPLPPADGCTPGMTRCSNNVPQRCSVSQRWWQEPTARSCSTFGAACCRARSPYGNEVHACVPAAACLPEPGGPTSAPSALAETQ